MSIRIVTHRTELREIEILALIGISYSFELGDLFKSKEIQTECGALGKSVVSYNAKL